jgi:hypothetical protein
MSLFKQFTHVSVTVTDVAKARVARPVDAR